MWVILPVKELAKGKSRLAEVLTAAERTTLARQLLRRTLAVVAEAAGVIVVSRDTAVAQIAAAYGAVSVAEEKGAGLNGAIRLGLQTAVERGASQALILPSDLPFLRPADVRLLAETAPGRILIASDRRGAGTNALRLPLPTEFRVRYGRDSYRQHLAEARRRCLPVRIITSPALQFDLDTPQDWQEASGEIGSICEIEPI